MVLKERYILYLYFLLWFLYELQGVFWTAGNSLSLVIILSLTAISLFYAVKVNLEGGRRLQFINALNLLLIMFTLYGIVYIIEGPRATLGVTQSKPYNYLKAIYNSLLPIYTFYYFSRKKILNHSLLTRIGPLFFVMVVVSYWHFEEVRSGMQMRDGAPVDVVNYECYAFLSLFTVLTVYHKRAWIQYLGIVFVMTFIFMGMKRGAIFVGILCTVWYSYELLKSSKGYKRVLVILLSTFALLFLSYLVLHLLETNDFFHKRFQSTVEGNTSGRDILFYRFFYYYIYDTDAFQFLFGSGANATLSVSYNYAHNDWLELAVNQGVLGLFLYLYFWYTFFRSWNSMDRNHYTHFTFGLLIMISFLKTFFSRTYGDMDVYSTCMLGYCLGTIQPKNAFSSDFSSEEETCVAQNRVE